MNARKIIFIAVIIVCSLFSMSAQFKIGLKIGGNISSLYTDMNGVVSDIYKPKISFQVGTAAEFMFSKNIGIQAELMYINTGAILNGKELLKAMSGLNPELALKGDVSMNMLQLPLLLKVKIPVKANMDIYLLGGGFGSYTLSSEQRMNFTQDTESLKVNWDLFGNELRIGQDSDDNIFRQQRYNAGIAAETGIEIFNQIAIGVGYRRVLNNMSSFTYSSGNTVVMQPKISLSNFMLSLSYFF